MIAPRGPENLARRIAGLSVLSRQLIEIARAGVPEAVVLAPEDEALAREAQTDLARAGLSLQLRFQGPDEATPLAHALLLDGEALVRAQPLGMLLHHKQAAALSLRGRVVARRLERAAAASEVLEALGPSDGGAIEVGEPLALELDTEARAARALLRETAKPSDGLVSQYLNRPVSQAISGLLLRWPGIRPGHATALTALSALAMFLALAAGRPISLALGCLLFHLTSIIDGVDGEIARATHRASPRGAALDTAVDMATNLAFALGLTIGLTRLYGEPYAELGGFASMGLLLGIGLMTLLVRRGSQRGSFDVLKTVYRARAGTSSRLRVVKLVQTATSRDFFAFVFAVLGMLGLARFIPWILAFGVSLWLLIIAGGASLIFMVNRAPARR